MVWIMNNLETEEQNLLNNLEGNLEKDKIENENGEETGEFGVNLGPLEAYFNKIIENIVIKKYGPLL